METNNITQTNDLIRAASVWVVDQLGLRKSQIGRSFDLDGNVELRWVLKD